MKRISLILIVLLFTIFNNAELKIEDVLSFLRTEASKAVQNLFGISFSFTGTLFEKEVIIQQGNPTITAKLSSSCSTILKGSNDGFFTVKKGIVISKNGIDLTSPNLSLREKNLDADFESMTLTLSKKLKGAVEDGIIYFSISPTQIQITITITKSNGDNNCDGTLTLTIENKKYINPSLKLKNNENNEKLFQYDYIPQYEKIYQPSNNNRNFDDAKETVAKSAVLAIGTVVLYKFVKSMTLFAIAGPAGAVIGAAT